MYSQLIIKHTSSPSPLSGDWEVGPKIPSFWLWLGICCDELFPGNPSRATLLEQKTLLRILIISHFIHVRALCLTFWWKYGQLLNITRAWKKTTKITLVNKIPGKFRVNNSSRNDDSFAGSSVVKNPPANAGDAGSIPELGRSPGEGTGNPLQYSGKSHRQRSLVGYSPWGRKRVGHDLATKQ